eukprot:gene27465-34185_t
MCGKRPSSSFLNFGTTSAFQQDFRAQTYKSMASHHRNVHRRSEMSTWGDKRTTAMFLSCDPLYNASSPLIAVVETSKCHYAIQMSFAEICTIPHLPLTHRSFRALNVHPVDPYSSTSCIPTAKSAPKDTSLSTVIYSLVAAVVILTFACYCRRKQETPWTRENLYFGTRYHSGGSNLHGPVCAAEVELSTASTTTVSSHRNYTSAAASVTRLPLFMIPRPRTHRPSPTRVIPVNDFPRTTACVVSHHQSHSEGGSADSSVRSVDSLPFVIVAEALSTEDQEQMKIDHPDSPAVFVSRVFTV